MRALAGVTFVALVLAQDGCASRPVPADSGPVGPRPDSVALPTCEWARPETCKVKVAGPLAIKWEWKVPPANMSTWPSAPAIGPDGTIYLAEYFGLHAINPDGSGKWTDQDFHGSRLSPPVVGPDGNIYVALSSLLSYGPDGTLRWAFSPDGPFPPPRESEFPEHHWAARPVVSASGTIYLASADQKVYAVSSAGKLLWRYVASAPLHEGPEPFLMQGRLIVPVPPALIVALDSQSGEELWRRALCGDSSASLTSPVAAAGRIIVAVTCWTAQHHEFLALDPRDGSNVWQLTFPDASGAGLLSTPEATIVTVVGRPANRPSQRSLVALSSQGKVLFDTALDTDPASVQAFGALGGDGLLYAFVEGLAASGLVAYSVRDGSRQAHLPLPGFNAPTVPALLPDGTLIAAWQPKGGSSSLFAVQSESAGLARQGWPRAGLRDNRNSGDADGPLP